MDSTAWSKRYLSHLSHIARLQSLQIVDQGPQKVKRVFKQVKQILPFSKSVFSDLVTPNDSISALVKTDRMCCTSLSVNDKHSNDLPSSLLSQIVATWLRASSSKSKSSIMSEGAFCCCNDFASNTLIEWRLSRENSREETAKRNKINYFSSTLIKRWVMHTT